MLYGFKVHILMLAYARIHDLLKKKYSKSEPQEIVWEEEMSCAANVNGIWERGKVCNVSSGSVAEVTNALKQN